MSESLKSKAYEFIKERILRCEYEPMSFLDVGAIADELSISRTPVRDAVSMLEQDELVQILPRHGIMVLGISADLINGIISTRKIVEPYAARSAALKADADVMQQMRTVFSEPGKDISALIEEDTKLHSYIVSCTENTYIIRMMDRIYSNNYRLMLYGSGMPGVFEASNAEHIAIIDAILERNPDKAEKSMLRHLSHSERTAYESAGILMKK
ncbi:MAG: GntR family transcriptional regulator [Oscillospiraceae bacterium]|jgi:Transcriptional regulators|nr:GntR family transcriptional regulator [Oscillospiraceae bacterium]MBQ3999522.1 GntR family transcriptional regulator [Oscillospiraceae bacterium]MBQ4241150.1 GntR family transcriptional regulator [Oscillospiraceae bacterium]MBQ5412411.1 GntR family transcriptional regulator [Oscillospiraceae bacterium]